MTITLNRPELGNAWCGPGRALFHTFTELASRDDIKVVVLQGAGKHFCSGLDLVDGGWGFSGRSVGMLLGVQRRIARLSGHAPLPPGGSSQRSGCCLLVEA